MTKSNDSMLPLTTLTTLTPSKPLIVVIINQSLSAMFLRVCYAIYDYFIINIYNHKVVVYCIYVLSVRTYVHTVIIILS